MLKSIKKIKEDFKSIVERDPASRSWFENLLCCQGFHAVLFYRISHFLWTHHFKLVARLLSNLARVLTGVEIHPGSKVGNRFFIDHGMGIVIGETSDIGDDVTIYQGVTLGGTSLNKGKRHPTIQDRVIIGAGAILLGPICIGHDSRIGSSSVVIHDVPGFSTVVGIPGRVVHRRQGIVDDNRHFDLAHNSLPDPFGDAIEGLQKSVQDLHARLIQLEQIRNE